MSNLPDTPSTKEATSLLNRIKTRVKQRLREVEKVPVSILLWGPGIDSNSPLSDVRRCLCSILREKGHAAVFSEDLCDPDCNYSIRLQQLAQAQEFDLVVAIPCTAGSIAEVHDFASDRRVNAKVLIFLNNKVREGYSPKSLEAITTLLSCHIVYYNEENIITEVTLLETQKIREMKYILAGRY